MALLTSHGDDLGAFTLAYLGETRQITGRTLAGATLAKTWSYLPNVGDRRLASIDNTGLAAGQYSNYAYTTMPETLIGAISEASDLAPVYPSPPAQSGTYNDLNQLTDLSGQALAWDADGNLLSDGTRDYAWDAENRLVRITYPGAPGKETDFAYDGLGRRVAITSIPAGGGEGVTTSYLWCGTRLCQARDAGGATTREYYAEGEYLPGPPAQPYYYGIDQLGSVRRVFVSTASAPGYAYDPYGNPLQGAPPTDFGYAGMFHNADSGLDLTLSRAYDPTIGRWLSRDPLGERGEPAGNLYPYVQGNPISTIDPAGLLTLQLGLAGGGTFFGIAVQGGLGIVFDTQGNIGTYSYGGIGVGAGIEGGVEGSIQFSNAPNIFDLRDRFSNASISIGAGVAGSLDLFDGNSVDGPVTGGITFGAGFRDRHPLPAPIASCGRQRAHHEQKHDPRPIPYPCLPTPDDRRRVSLLLAAQEEGVKERPVPWSVPSAALMTGAG